MKVTKVTADARNQENIPIELFTLLNVLRFSAQLQDIRVQFTFFLNEDFIRKSTKTTLLTKYIHITMYISPPAAHTKTIHNIK